MAAQPNNLEILDNGCKVVGLLASVSPVARQGLFCSKNKKQKNQKKITKKKLTFKRNKRSNS